MNGFWAEGAHECLGGSIYCWYHEKALFCQDKNTEPYEGKCWCSIGYKSSNGMAPCTPCDDNSLSTTIGSSMCACSKDSFSINGYDTPNRCIKCPDFSYTDGIGNNYFQQFK